MQHDVAVQRASLPLRNKILVAFSHEVANKDDILSKVFSSNVSAGSQIYRDVKWSTKYYSVLFDVYIDIFDDLSEWLSEFCSSDYHELQQVLAGFIVVMPCKEKDDVRKILQLEQCKDFEGSFAAILATKVSFSNEMLCLLEEELVVKGIEMTVDQEIAGSGFEKFCGVERIREMIDTYEWPVDMVQLNHNTVAKEPPLTVPEIPLEEVLSKLHEARAKYLGMDSSAEGEKFAKDVAEELGKYL
ncbi:LANO_0D01112g1_1 [Lachancea nothofagi CBS 11611]|uniref:Increased recombination centers protein 6 n=1 Tax=Lachancea nothofagi CBS 11611 TaxID=1266666 RepID=A0A1G4JDS8_9SACH|nr:LANO_0D01112g1_1 [Lachancea nothofagi CBS 11611]